MSLKCNAIAVSTSERCKRNSLPGSKYCMFHLEKTPLLLGALLGAMLSVVASDVWHRFVPTEESRQLAQARAEIDEVRAQNELAKTERSALDRRVLSLRADLGESRAEGALKQAELERELRQRTEALAALSEKTRSAVTGGDSYCFLTILRTGDGTGHLLFAHQGENPLYDVTARMIDLDRFEETKGSRRIENLAYTETVVSLGTLVPDHGAMHGALNLDGFPQRGYNIFFSARNGAFHESLRLRKVDGVWLQALKVIRGNRTIFEQIDDHYPRNETGGIDW